MRKFMTGLLVSAALGVYAQPSYQLPEFIIFPEERTVCNLPTPESALVRDRRVNYNTTELVCIARGITFKEYVDDFDLSTFKVLRYSADQYTNILFADKDGLYRDFYPEESGYRSMEDLSGKALLAERVYMDKNDKTLYFVDLLGDELIELINIPPLFDFKTLKPVCDNFFFNKDGLYVFGHTYSDSPYHVDDSSVNLLQKSNGKLIVPQIYKHYFVYDGVVYARTQSDAVKTLDLKPTRIRDLSRIIVPGLLTDGTTTYSGFYKTGSAGLERVTNWKTIAERGECTFIADRKANRIFMPSEVSVAVNGMEAITSSLVWDGEKYLSINSDATIIPFESLYIYNHKTKQHEELDWRKYKRLGPGLYIYAGILIRNGVPVKGHYGLKLSNIRPLILDSGTAYFYTDGQSIFCMDSENTILKNVDMPTLQVVNNHLLYDKNHIYSLKVNELSVIPYRELGFTMRVIED